LVRLVIVTNIQTRCWGSRRLCMGEIHAGSRGRGGEKGGEGAAAAPYAAGGGQSTMTRLPPFLRLRLRHHVRDIIIFLPIFHPVPFRVRCEVKMNEGCQVKATFDLKTLRQDPSPTGKGESRRRRRVNKNQSPKHVLSLHAYLSPSLPYPTLHTSRIVRDLASTGVRAARTVHGQGGSPRLGGDGAWA